MKNALFTENTDDLCPEAIERRTLKACKPPEGQRPYVACKYDDKEIANDARDVLISKERRERSRKSRLDKQDAAETEHELQKLGVPGSRCLEADEMAVDEVDRKYRYRTAEEGVGVLDAAREIVWVESRVVGYRHNVEEVAKRDDHTADRNEGHILVEALLTREDGTKKQNEKEAYDKRYADVK